MMSNNLDDLVYQCEKLASVWSVYDELWNMRIHDQETCNAFEKEIWYRVGMIKKLCESELSKK